MIVKLVILAVAFASPGATSNSIQGDWRGDSTCQQQNTACRNEKVVYHVSAPDSAGKVTIDADKLVDGKPVNMGPVVLHYNKDKQTLDGQDGPRLWHFQIQDHAMDGTLTVSGTLIRKVELKKD